MTDPGLLKQIVAGGVSPDDAIDMVNRVSEAILARLLAGKGVKIDGVGRLVRKMRRRRINAPGPHHKKIVQETLVGFSNGALLAAGEPYEPL